MMAAGEPIQRPPRARVLSVDRHGAIGHWPRSAWAQLLRPGDLVVGNDAATLPASLSGRHAPTAARIEVRLAGRRCLDLSKVSEFVAVVFGQGDFRTRTEDRPPPPALSAGDRLELGPLRATIAAALNHPRLVLLRFEGPATEIWRGLARHGRPIQYSHIRAPLALWDTWSPIAGPPVAFEAPSAGFALSWAVLAALAARSIRFATLTHAAGISSTGDPKLDALLPFDEPYRIPASTSRAVDRTRARGGRVVAVGTTVVRALEHAASRDGSIAPGEGLATRRIGRHTRLGAVDVLLSGTHEPGSSHHELLRAFAADATLERMDRELDRHGYRTHEFGDSVLIESAHGHAAAGARPGAASTRCATAVA